MSLSNLNLDDAKFEALCNAIASGVELIIQDNTNDEVDVFISSVSLHNMEVTYEFDDVEQHPPFKLTDESIQQAIIMLNNVGDTDAASTIEQYTNNAITIASIQSIIDYIDEGEPDISVIKGELGEIILRSNGEYFKEG